MIDIIILTEDVNTNFTLASLLDSDENFRLHLFSRTGPQMESAQPTIKWAMANFREVYCYQTPYMHQGTSSNKIARTILQFKEHWKNKAPKGFPIERVIVHTRGARLFNGKFAGNVPTVQQMGTKVCYFSRKYQYFDHKFYGNYYSILGMEAKKEDHEKDFVLLNWAKFKLLSDNATFFDGGRATPQKTPNGKAMRPVDSYVLSANNDIFFKKVKEQPHGYMPLYFDMTVDDLIKKESIGPKDTINHNIMMRKAFSVNISRLELFQEFHVMPTLYYMGVPWDMWGTMIDNIPLNIRNSGFNERILQKANHQKRYLRKVLEAGYLLGKV
jgi:hypothetical protein